MQRRMRGLLVCAVLLVSSAYQSSLSTSGRNRRGITVFRVRARKSDTAAALPVWPVQACVFAQMIGEGIAISSLPAHMTMFLGASPAVCGLAVSSFSVAQLVCCPLLVEASERYGRLTVLRICLLGATLANLGIAASSTAVAIAACRFISGIFAASVPVAQAAVTDYKYDKAATPLALGRLSATSQSAVVLGPLVVAALLTPLGTLGISEDLRLRFVFILTAIFSFSVLSLLAVHPVANAWQRPAKANEMKAHQNSGNRENDTNINPNELVVKQDLLVQPLLRLVALIVGWSLTLSVYCYGLFAPQFLHYDQARLSAAISAGAVTTIAASLAFPRIVHTIGEHAASTLGLLILSIGLAGHSLVRTPLSLHFALYLLNRFGSGVADTATATLVARYSVDNRNRARNLGFIQSVRAAARIFTPPLSGSLFSFSSNFQQNPGALPYLLNSVSALVVAPIPLLLRARNNRKEKRY